MSFSKPRSSTVITERSVAKVAVQRDRQSVKVCTIIKHHFATTASFLPTENPKMAAYAIKVLYVLKIIGERMVATPPTVKAKLFITRAFTLGLSDAQPQKTRPRVFATPMQERMKAHCSGEQPVRVNGQR